MIFQLPRERYVRKFLFIRGKYILSQPLHTFLKIFTIASQLCLRPGCEPEAEANTSPRAVQPDGGSNMRVLLTHLTFVAHIAAVVHVHAKIHQQHFSKFLTFALFLISCLCQSAQCYANSTCNIAFYP